MACATDAVQLIASKLKSLSEPGLAARFLQRNGLPLFRVLNVSET
jgi:hypothetical protein